MKRQLVRLLAVTGSAIAIILSYGYIAVYMRWPLDNSIHQTEPLLLRVSGAKGDSQAVFVSIKNVSKETLEVATPTYEISLFVVGPLDWPRGSLQPENEINTAFAPASLAKSLSPGGEMQCSIPAFDDWSGSKASSGIYTFRLKYTASIVNRMHDYPRQALAAITVYSNCYRVLVILGRPYVISCQSR